MNILIDALPDYIMVDGKKYCVNTDFRIWLEFDRTMRLNNLSIKDKFMMIVKLCFDKERCKVLPDDAQKTADALLNFFLCQTVRKSDKDGEKKNNILDFSYDSQYIYSAFLTQYGIDLLSVPYMHWYIFSALFKGLEEERRIMKIMNWRLLDVEEIQDEEKRNKLKRIKDFYTLPDDRSEKQKEEDLAEIISKAF